MTYAYVRKQNLDILENSIAIRGETWRQGISSKGWENVSVELYTQQNY